MADEANITEAHNWFTNTKKVIQFQITTGADPTAWELVWELRKSHTEDAYLIHKETGTGLTIDGPNKLVSLTIDAADTADLEPGTYAHALKRTDSVQPTMLSRGTAVLQQAAVH